MKEKITRKDLKRNDLAETVGRTVEYVTSHRKGVAEGIAVAAGLALLVAGFYLVKAYRENRAGKALSAGLSALQAPLSTDPGASSAPRSYSTVAARDKAADDFFRKAAGYGGTAPGRAAAVILAARVEKPATAAETFTRAAREGRSEVAAAAEIAAARLLASQGKATEAIERLKRAIESPAATVPKDALLYTLAQVYESSGASSDARATYQRIVNDYPNSPYRADARQKLPNG
ncbi:MAG: tetratricopeptide repeat protein [Thermoanaerobaculia bacterium]